MRELFKALSELEANLIEQHGVSLNEAMALCCIGGDRLTAERYIRAYGFIGFTHIESDSFDRR